MRTSDAEIRRQIADDPDTAPELTAKDWARARIVRPSQGRLLDGVADSAKSPGIMKYVCDAPNGGTWFRIETEAEAERESAQMQHAVEKFFRREREKAQTSFKPASANYIEQNIGLEAHLQRAMPLFLTLRDNDGNGLVTAMLPPGGQEDDTFRTIIVGQSNGDPYADHGAAIEALGQHFGLTLDRESCYPYRR